MCLNYYIVLLNFPDFIRPMKKHEILKGLFPKDWTNNVVALSSIFGLWEEVSASSAAKFNKLLKSEKILFAMRYVGS